MFKSLFAKYITAFILIILISFSLIIGVISAIITQYSGQAKCELMETAAVSSVTFLQNKMQNLFSVRGLNEHFYPVGRNLQNGMMSSCGILRIINADFSGKCHVPFEDQLIIQTFFTLYFFIT